MLRFSLLLFFSLHLRPFFYLSFRFPIHISFINPPSLFLFSDDKKKIMEWINQSAHRWALSSEYIFFSFLYTYKLYLYLLLLVLRPFFFDFFLLHHLLLPSFFNNCLLIQLFNLLVLCLSLSLFLVLASLAPFLSLSLSLYFFLFFLPVSRSFYFSYSILSLSFFLILGAMLEHIYNLTVQKK